MNIQERHISTTKTARYYTLGDASKEITHLWLVCHGYGQLAQYFIKHFAPLQKEGCLIVAPEGLSRFYLEGFRGRIGASWMTKDGRLNEIKDYLKYLDHLYEEILKEIDSTPATVTLLGFSQGAATAARWAFEGRVKCNQLVLWSGLLPPESNLDRPAKRSPAPTVLFVYGTQDTHLTDSVIKQGTDRLKAHNITYQTIRFDGGHELNTGALKKLAGKFILKT